MVMRAVGLLMVVVVWALLLLLLPPPLLQLREWPVIATRAAQTYSNFRPSPLRGKGKCVGGDFDNIDSDENEKMMTTMTLIMIMMMVVVMVVVAARRLPAGEVLGSAVEENTTPLCYLTDHRRSGCR
jgi:hypothetical protein